MAKRKTERYWYHCTTDDHGERYSFARITPKTLGTDEPRTPRVCVAPSVIQCFIATLYAPEKPVFIYRTTRPRKAYDASRDVWDAIITGEHWIWPPVPFERVGTVEATLAKRIQEPTRFYHKMTGKNASLKIRACQLIRATKFLGEYWPNRFCSRFSADAQIIQRYADVLDPFTVDGLDYDNDSLSPQLLES